MKSTHRLFFSLHSLGCCATVLLIAGCTTTPEPGSPGTASQNPARFTTTDGRTIDIGRRSQTDGGWSFKDPHLDKCWIADGFDFSGYDTLYLAPTASTAKFHDDEAQPHELAKENLVIELNRVLTQKGIFANIVTRETDIKPGAHVLKLQNTIVEYSKGGRAARYFAGLYGGGQPNLRVEGKMTDGEKPVFTYEARRSGVSAGARMAGVFIADEDIQVKDIRSITLDLSDFMAAIAGKYQPK